jgi:hypothetical protein
MNLNELRSQSRRQTMTRTGTRKPTSSRPPARTLHRGHDGRVHRAPQGVVAGLTGTSAGKNLARKVAWTFVGSSAGAPHARPLGGDLRCCRSRRARAARRTGALPRLHRAAPRSPSPTRSSGPESTPSIAPNPRTVRHPCHRLTDHGCSWTYTNFQSVAARTGCRRATQDREPARLGLRRPWKRCGFHGMKPHFPGSRVPFVSRSTAASADTTG